MGLPRFRASVLAFLTISTPLCEAYQGHSRFEFRLCGDVHVSKDPFTAPCCWRLFQFLSFPRTHTGALLSATASGISSVSWVPGRKVALAVPRRI